MSPKTSHFLNRASIGYRISMLYGGMKRRARDKDLELGFTKEEFSKIARRNSIFKRLHKAWVDSNFNYSITVTVDRKDNSKGYIKGNIQFLTLSENSIKGQKEKREMGLVSGSRPCRFIKGNEVLAFNSAREAARFFKKPSGSVSRACRTKFYLINGYSGSYL